MLYHPWHGVTITCFFSFLHFSHLTLGSLRTKTQSFISVSKEYGQASGTQWMSMKRLSGWLKFSCLWVLTPESTYIAWGWYTFSPGRYPLGLGSCLQSLCSSTNGVTVRTEGTLAKTQEIPVSTRGCARVGFQDTRRHQSEGVKRTHSPAQLPGPWPSSTSFQQSDLRQAIQSPQALDFLLWKTEITESVFIEML